MQNNTNSKKIIFSVITAAVLVGVAALLYKPTMELVQNPAEFSQWIQSLGFKGILAFMGLNLLQVVIAVIPAGPFEMAAGLAFGPFKGSLLCSIAMTLGGVIIVLLVRQFGMKFVTLFISKEKLDSVSFLNNTEKLQSVVFLLFLIPGAPKDVLTYAVGFSKLPLWQLALIFFVGRYPSILLTAMSGSALGNARYGVVAGIAIAAIVLYLAGSRIYKKLRK